MLLFSMLFPLLFLQIIPPYSLWSPDPGIQFDGVPRETYIL